MEPPHHQSDGPLLERARDVQREALHRQVLELATDLQSLRETLNERFEAGRDRMERIEYDVRENTRITVENTTAAHRNTEATQRLQDATAGLMGWLHAFEGAFKVLNGFAALAKPVGIIAVAATAIAGGVTAVWHFFHR